MLPAVGCLWPANLSAGSRRAMVEAQTEADYVPSAETHACTVTLGKTDRLLLFN